jgi:hypothetical protein
MRRPAAATVRAAGWCRFPRAAGRVQMLCSRCSTWRRPARAGITAASTPEPYSSAPTRLPCRVSRRASTATNSARHVALALLAGAEVDRRAQVQQEPRRHLAVFGEHAHVRRLQPRRDVPVDVAHVVVVLVLAQVGQVQPAAAHQGAVVALQQAVQPADARSIPGGAARSVGRRRPVAAPGWAPVAACGSGEGELFMFQGFRPAAGILAMILPMRRRPSRPSDSAS